eukprot:m.39018 g.39018  ORF g.39018 m.39018 type:complete len:304 (+) comp18067_c0_seq1:147-1058(+)
MLTFLTCNGDSVKFPQGSGDLDPFDFYEKAIDDNTWRAHEGDLFRHNPTCCNCLRMMRIQPTKLTSKYLEKSDCSFARYRKAVNQKGTTMLRVEFHSPTSYVKGTQKHRDHAHALWNLYQAERGETNRLFDFHAVPGNADEFRNDDVVAALNDLWGNRGKPVDEHQAQKLRGTVVAHFYKPANTPEGEKLIAMCSYDLLNKYVCAKTFVFDPDPGAKLRMHRSPSLGTLCFYLGLDLTLLLKRPYLCVGFHSPHFIALQWKEKLIGSYPDCIELLGLCDSQSARPFQWQSSPNVRQTLLLRPI